MAETTGLFGPQFSILRIIRNYGYNVENLVIKGIYYRKKKYYGNLSGISKSICSSGDILQDQEKVNQCCSFKSNKSILIATHKLTLKCSQAGSLILLLIV